MFWIIAVKRPAASGGVGALDILWDDGDQLLWDDGDPMQWDT